MKDRRTKRMCTRTLTGCERLNQRELFTLLTKQPRLVVKFCQNLHWLFHLYMSSPVSTRPLARMTII